MSKRIVEISPSVLGADLMRLGEEIKMAESLGIHWLHLDNMDGHFAPNISFGPDFVRAIRRQTNLFLDTHLMLSRPMQYIEAYAKAGADLITVHAESCKHLDRTIDSIKERGILAGVALNPATPLQTVEYVLEKVDMVLIMTVNPGFGGQKFIPYTLQKVRDLKKMIDARGLKTDIEVDGGVNLSNVEEIMSAGANIIVAGSAVFNGDVAENTQMFLDILNS